MNVRHIVGISIFAGCSSLLIGIFSGVHIGILIIRILLSVAFSGAILMVLRGVFRVYLAPSSSKESTKGSKVDVVIDDAEITDNKDPITDAKPPFEGALEGEEEIEAGDYKSERLASLREDDPSLMANAIRTMLHESEKRDTHA